MVTFSSILGADGPAVPTAQHSLAPNLCVHHQSLVMPGADIASMTGRVDPWFLAFLVLIVPQSPLLNTQFANPPPSFGNVMTCHRSDDGEPTSLRC